MNSEGGTGAVYKGLALANKSGANLLYAANFHAGTVDVFDTSFHSVSLGTGAFSDALLPAGFAPFNIENLSNQLYVTFGKQDPQTLVRGQVVPPSATIHTPNRDGAQLQQFLFTFGVRRPLRGVKRKHPITPPSAGHR